MDRNLAARQTRQKPLLDIWEIFITIISRYLLNYSTLRRTRNDWKSKEDDDDLAWITLRRTRDKKIHWRRQFGQPFDPVACFWLCRGPVTFALQKIFVTRLEYLPIRPYLPTFDVARTEFCLWRPKEFWLPLFLTLRWHDRFHLKKNFGQFDKRIAPARRRYVTLLKLKATGEKDPVRFLRRNWPIYSSLFHATIPAENHQYLELSCRKKSHTCLKFWSQERRHRRTGYNSCPVSHWRYLIVASVSRNFRRKR